MHRFYTRLMHTKATHLVDQFHQCWSGLVVYSICSKSLQLCHQHVIGRDILGELVMASEICCLINLLQPLGDPLLRQTLVKIGTSTKGAKQLLISSSKFEICELNAIARQKKPYSLRISDLVCAEMSPRSVKSNERKNFKLSCRTRRAFPQLNSPSAKHIARQKYVSTSIRRCHSTRNRQCETNRPSDAASENIRLWHSARMSQLALQCKDTSNLGQHQKPKF